MLCAVGLEAEEEFARFVERRFRHGHAQNWAFVRWAEVSCSLLLPGAWAAGRMWSTDGVRRMSAWDQKGKGKVSEGWVPVKPRVKRTVQRMTCPRLSSALLLPVLLYFMLSVTTTIINITITTTVIVTTCNYMYMMLEH